MEEKEAPCIFCGVVTTEWWFYDGRVGFCRCVKCLNAGHAETEQEKAYFETFKTLVKKDSFLYNTDTF